MAITNALVSGSKISDLGDGEFGGGHGIEIIESGGGNLAGTVEDSNSAGNERVGVFGDETGAGTGAVTLIGVTFIGAPNGEGNTGGNAIVP